MTSATEPLREEHRELLPHVDALRVVADGIGHFSADQLRSEVDAILDFLNHHLIPHAEAEERVLYPMVGKVLGAPRATATMSRDHVEVGRLAAELNQLRTQIGQPQVEATVSCDLRRVLYGLHALLQVHFAKEEEIYLPLLDAALTPDVTATMFEQMEAAAASAKARHSGS